MSDSEQTTSSAGSSCGACGALAQLADVTCAACGVLLAAYQAPRGATGSDLASATSATITTAGDTSATHHLPSPSMSAEAAGDSTTAAPMFSTPSFTPPAFEPSPIHRPKSQSPIGDALRRPGSLLSSGKDAGEVDALTTMADGNDELSHMASGVDELSEMAAGGDTSLATQVEVELAGAKVTFDGSTPVIESDQVEIAQSPGSAPQIVTSKSDSHSVPARKVATSRDRARNPVIYEQTVANGATTSEHSEPASTSANGRGSVDSATVMRWLPFILIGLFILGFGRSLPGMGGIIGFVVVIGLIYVLLKWTAASSRKTTTMPRDDSWNRKKRR